MERAGLRLSYSDLRTTADDRDLAGRCLGTILDFADRHEKRLLVVVENLNMLFADTADPGRRMAFCATRCRRNPG